MSYLVFRISYFVYRISYIVHRISYIVYRISYIVYRIAYFVYRISYIMIFVRHRFGHDVSSTFGWIWHPFWMSFYVFCISFLNTCFGCFVFWFSIDFGTLNPQNAASCFGNTDDCLKLRFLKQLENIIISDSILVPFRHQFS